MDFSLLQELKLKVRDPSFNLPTQNRWYVTYDDKTELLDVVEIFNLMIDNKIFASTKCRNEKHDEVGLVGKDRYLKKQLRIIKNHLKEENKVLLHNLKKRREIIEEFQMKYESALTRLRDLDVMQDVLATV